MDASESLSWLYNDFTLFQYYQFLFLMYTDKDSNLICDLRTKYGEESVRTIRKWEITIKKMADYRNHRRFTLRCIKASITPVSCKLKNPLKTKESYNIIHKVEKHLLYEQVRNINNTLESLDKQRETQYRKFKDMLFNSNQHVQDPDLDLERSRLFINKIKDHRHSKIKEKHTNKFKRLYFKWQGYHHNLNSHCSKYRQPRPPKHLEQTLKCAIQYFQHFHYNFQPNYSFCHTHGPHTFQQHNRFQPSTQASTPPASAIHV